MNGWLGPHTRRVSMAPIIWTGRLQSATLVSAPTGPRDAIYPTGQKDRERQ